MAAHAPEPHGASPVIVATGGLPAMQYLMLLGLAILFTLAIVAIHRVTP
jgi:hypothetical protein